MPKLHHFRAAAERVYSALFDSDEFRYQATRADCQHLADTLTAVFRHSMIERIEAALRGEEDPLWKVVREARARKEPAK